MADANIVIDDLGTNGDKIVKVANFSGQLDESNVDEKIQVLYQTVEKTPQKLALILNFENLEYMNSKSIGYITDLYGKVTENGGQIVICAAKPNIADILQVVGLSQLVQVVDTLNTAKSTVGLGSAPAAPAPAPAPAPTETPNPTETPTPTPQETYKLE